MKTNILGWLLIGTLGSCSVSRQIEKIATTLLLKDTSISTGHIGISIYEPATSKYWYNRDATKYFVPASNTKLFTLYAGLKYLGDSLVSLTINEYEDKIVIAGNGDPTFLHPDFSYQPVFDLLSRINKPILAKDVQLKADVYGRGWAWDDYNDSYMNERSSFPIFGNVVVFSGNQNNFISIPKEAVAVINFNPPSNKSNNGFINKVKRDRFTNSFICYTDGKEKKKIVVPFITSASLAFSLLADTLHKNISFSKAIIKDDTEKYIRQQMVYSQPSDSLFKPMMFNSDNFFAEQTLLMVSNKKLGYLSDEDIIDTLLKTDLKDIPQRPKWIDGSGLSRYNLFTPQSFIYILNKIKNEFGWNRLKNILPTGGQGTLTTSYIKDKGFIYAKTGTLSNHGALSGFLITMKGKLLIFSILTNQYQSGATPIRQATEKFLEEIREKY